MGCLWRVDLNSETRAWQESKSSPRPQRGRADQAYGQGKCTNLSLVIPVQLQFIFIITYPAGRLGVSSDPWSELCGAPTSSRTPLSAAQQQHPEAVGTGAGCSVAAPCSSPDLPRRARSSGCRSIVKHPLLLLSSRWEGSRDAGGRAVEVGRDGAIFSVAPVRLLCTTKQ